MLTINDLKGAVEDGVRLISKKPNIKDVEVYASASCLNVLRLCYASNIPSNGLEEPKSMEDFGISMRIHFKDGKIGFGKEDSGIDKKNVQRCYIKALRHAIKDEDFKSLPLPNGKPKLKNYADKSILVLDDKKTTDAAYKTLNSAFAELEKSKFQRDFNITGELNFLLERMAIKSTTGINTTDESTAALASLTTILELDNDVAGMWFGSSSHIKNLNTESIGATSAEKALSSTSAEKVNSGEYNVVLGQLAFVDMLHSSFSITLDAVDQKASPFVDKLDKKIANEKLTIYDDAHISKCVGTKAVTDEGLPTGKTKIVENGKLVNFLSSDYYSKKYSNDTRFNARNGFRGSGREYAAEPGISATNLIIKPGKFKDSELIKEIKNGLYIGRIWYTYPVYGFMSSDFTGTVRGDSYIIENGEIKSGLVPNTLRINDNLERIFQNITGLGKTSLPVIAWGEDSVVITPEVIVKGLKVERIAKGLY